MFSINNARNNVGKYICLKIKGNKEDNMFLMNNET